MTAERSWQRRPTRGPDAAPGWGALAAGAADRRRWADYWLAGTARGLGDFAVHHALRLAPIDFCSAVGGWLGRRAGRGALRHKSVRARTLLRRLRPALDEAALDDAVAAMWDGIGRAYTEFSVLERLIAADRVALDGREHLDRARAAGGPVMVIGVHLGNWELIGPALAAEGMAPRVIYQPPPSRFRHAIARASRLRAGLAALPPGRAGGAAAMRLLRGGGCLLMGIDEHVNGVVHGPVPGRPLIPAGNIVHAARLALATGAVVLPAWCLRTGGARFRVTVGDPVRLRPSPGRRPTEAAVVEAVHALDAVFRPILTDHLEQWYMLHEVDPDG